MIYQTLDCPLLINIYKLLYNKLWVKLIKKIDNYGNNVIIIIIIIIIKNNKNNNNNKSNNKNDNNSNIIINHWNIGLVSGWS